MQIKFCCTFFIASQSTTTLTLQQQQQQNKKNIITWEIKLFLIFQHCVYTYSTSMWIHECMQVPWHTDKYTVYIYILVQYC